jgi:hypothetical protein
VEIQDADGNKTKTIFVPNGGLMVDNRKAFIQTTLSGVGLVNVYGLYGDGAGADTTAERRVCSSSRRRRRDQHTPSATQSARLRRFTGSGRTEDF